MTQRKQLRAILRATVAPLAFGIGCTVAVAIGCAFLGRPHTMSSLYTRYHIGGSLWAGFHSDRIGAHHFMFYEPDRVVNAPEATPQVVAAPAWVTGSLDQRPRITWARLGCGWPQVGVVAGWDCLPTLNNPMPLPSDWGYVTVGKTSRRSPSEVRLYFDDKIPIRPNWFGLLWNSAFYAFAWLVAGAIVNRFVRRTRTRRKRCVECGYSLSGLAAETPCPECGHAYSA